MAHIEPPHPSLYCLLIILFFHFDILSFKIFSSHLNCSSPEHSFVYSPLKDLLHLHNIKILAVHLDEDGHAGLFHGRIHVVSFDILTLTPVVDNKCLD